MRETVKQSYGQKGAGVTWRHMASGASQNASKVHGFDKDFRMNHYHDMTRSFSTRKPQLGQLPFSKARFFRCSNRFGVFSVGWQLVV